MRINEMFIVDVTDWEIFLFFLFQSKESERRLSK